MSYIFKRQTLGLSLLTLMVFAGGCTMKPDAYFLVERDEVIIGELVNFYNLSQYSDSYLWDFGDGTTSEDIDPTHTYTATGEFTVTLTAFSSKGNSSQFKIEMTVVPTAFLAVVVQDKDEGFPVGGTKVSIYHSYNDWYYEFRPAAEGIADPDGYVEFNFLGPYTYFVSVTGEGYSNRSLGLYNLNYIRTITLAPDVHTTFTALVELD